VSVAIILSIYNKPVEMVQKTVEALLGSEGLEDAYLIVVDDGSDDEYKDQYEKEIWPMLDIDGEWLFTNTIAERPETYHIGGHNNPAYSHNIAFESAVKSGAETTILISSDLIVESTAIQRALAYPNSIPVLGKTVDSGRGTVFCSSTKIWPMCWFVKAATEDMAAVKFDEEYLKGMAFEDNDFMGRLFLRTKQMVIDDEIECIHQHHPPTAYSDGMRGFKISEKYTQMKWGGIPFRPNDVSLNWIAKSKKGKIDMLNPEALYLSQ
jgi:glycosyltransferase involved in cell wall biosynthesis